MLRVLIVVVRQMQVYLMRFQSVAMPASWQSALSTMHKMPCHRCTVIWSACPMRFLMNSLLQWDLKALVCRFDFPKKSRKPCCKNESLKSRNAKLPRDPHNPKVPRNPLNMLPSMHLQLLTPRCLRLKLLHHSTLVQQSLSGARWLPLLTKLLDTFWCGRARAHRKYLSTPTISSSAWAKCCLVLLKRWRKWSEKFMARRSQARLWKMPRSA
mmetsp:Transcript_83799/g.148504  ORF Transcript_83799/g.148504 Transcript_83799/m.148504 type:complete len:212 (+) Transcript_83799:193-828(+)